jgi:glycine/D-amino acid oxidase-like deaminating enzyme
MKYDFIIIGNGILGSTLAWKLSESDKNLKIAIFGKSHKPGSASVASGAMLNVFGEIEEGFENYLPLKERFKLGLEALKLWPNYIKEIEKKSRSKIEIRWGTNILNSAAGTKYEDSLFNYLNKIIQKSSYKNFFLGHNDPQKIVGLKSQAPYRTLRSIKINDACLNSEQLLNSIDKILHNIKNIDIIYENVSNIASKNNEHVATLENKKKYLGKNIVFCNGSFAQSLINKIPELKNNTPKLLFGAGSGIVLGKNNIRSKFSKFRDPYPNIAMRTMDRGHACGLHWLPFNHHSYLGASSAIYTTPEPYPRASTISFLLGDGLKQLSPNIGRSNIQKITYGFRPVSEDIFPLIGPSHLQGIWYLNGMKRDGLTCSPYIVPELIKLMLGKKSKLPKLFYPSRNLISYYNKDKAIEKAIIGRYNKENTHGMLLPDSNNFEKYYSAIKEEVTKIYTKNKFKNFGIHPELLSLYDSNQINLNLIKNK